MEPAGFDNLYKRLMKFDFVKPGKPPFHGANVGAVQPLVNEGALAIPGLFQSAYSDPLKNRLPAVIARLGHDVDQVETLAGAVYQHGPGAKDAALAPYLHRFLAVISNLYRSFLDRSKRRSLHLPLSEVLPPLASFQSDPTNGPYTMTVDVVEQLFGGKTGVVSMPASFGPHPFLYGSLAHETGGHDVLHADAGLLTELRAGVRKLFAGQQGLGVLWDYWMDEAASDVYGTLNIGPSFGGNLAMLLAIFIGQLQKPQAKSPHLRTQSGADETGALDPHPTDILRIALVQGVIDASAGLSPVARRRYNEALDAIAALTSPDATTIELSGYVRLPSGEAMEFNNSIRLDDLRAAARRVGEYIATVKLAALGGLSVQDIETWDDADENAAIGITGKLLQGNSVVGAGDDAQLVAGATMALFSAPEKYDEITKLLDAGLDDSYQNDPFWGVPVRDRFVIKSARPLPEAQPTPDPYAERIIDYNPLEQDGVDVFGAVTSHEITPIPWPQGKEPTPEPLKSPKLDAPLPKVDYVLITWTAAEANAMAAVLTPGYLAMPPSSHTGNNVWYRYGHLFDSYLPKLTGRSPAKTAGDLGKYFVTRFGKGGKQVLCFKSGLHLARDGKEMPVKDLFKQIIKETEAKLVISTGTAGGIGSREELGDVVATSRARFDCQGMFKSAPFNGKTYTSDFKLEDAKYLDQVNEKLIAANAGQLPRAPRRPRVFTTSADLGEPAVIVTTDIFAFDDQTDYYGLQGLGAMVEMDDAVLGLACEEIGAKAPKWIAIRNASDPQMRSIAEKEKAAQIYEKYGYWTTIPSVLACWAVVMGS